MSVAFTPAGDNIFADIRFVITICIFKENKMGRLSNDHTAVCKYHAGRNVKIFSENSELISPAVSVSIFTYLDPVASYPILLTYFIRIIDSFNNPQAPFFIPRHSYRLNNIRLGSKKFDLKINWYLYQLL